MNRISVLAVMLLSAAALTGPARAQNTITNINQLTNYTGIPFLRQAAADFVLEGNLGLLATTRSRNLYIQQFGQRLYVDDSASFHGVQTWAASQGIALRGLNNNERRVAQSVWSLTGVQFDRGFIGFVITNNLYEINLYQQATTNVINPTIRTFANQQLPLLWNHLLQAINIGESLQPPVTIQ